MIPESTNATLAGQEVERLRLDVAKAIAGKTYAYCTVTTEGSDQYDCGEWEEFGCDAQATYLAAADAVLAALATPSVATPAGDVRSRIDRGASAALGEMVWATPADDAGVLDFGRAYFERGFIACYAWAATKLPSSQMSDAVIDRAWDHRDEGMDGDDMLPVQFPHAAASPKAPSVAIGAREVACPKCGGKWCSVDLCLPKTPSKAGSPSAALERESWTGNPHGLANELRRVANLWREGFRLPQLLRDAADEIDCLAPGSTLASASIPADVERLAQFLHDEGGFHNAMTGRTWPEHDGDTGQRDGGWVKIVPSDVTAHFRDVARRWLQPGLAARPSPVERDA